MAEDDADVGLTSSWGDSSYQVAIDGNDRAPGAAIIDNLLLPDEDVSDSP